MTNQAAQTMPERTYMTRDEALKIARACAYAKCHTHGYLPRTAKEAADWQPHEWVLDAIRWNAILQPVRVSEAGVSEGWVLVPARMELTPENMAALAFMLGGDPEAKDADERWNGGTLWVGETVGDNGEKYYGLNVANVECYEEGSIPIVEFAAAPAASGAYPDALPDGTLSKSTAKRVEALAASGGEDGWSLAMRVREALDRASCPDHFMRIAVETITGDAPHPPASASVSERARDDLHVAICQAVALMNMEPMTTPGLLQAHDILRKAIS